MLPSAGNVIKGWDKGVATMKKNEKCVLTITAPYAYGDAGSPPTIPGGATLKFEVELLSWKSIKDICGDGGIIKTLVAEGKKWESPKPDDEVKSKRFPWAHMCSILSLDLEQVISI